MKSPLRRLRGFGHNHPKERRGHQPPPAKLDELVSAGQVRISPLFLLGLLLGELWGVIFAAMMHSEQKLDLGRHIVLWIFLVFQFGNLNCCAVFRVEWVVHFLVGVSFRSSVIQSFSATDQKLPFNWKLPWCGN